MSSSPRLQKQSIPRQMGWAWFSPQICLLRVSRPKSQMSHLCTRDLLGAAEASAQTRRVHVSPKRGKGPWVCWALSSHWAGWKQPLLPLQTASSQSLAGERQLSLLEVKGDMRKMMVPWGWRSFKVADWNPTALLYLSKSFLCRADLDSTFIYQPHLVKTN